MFQIRSSDSAIREPFRMFTQSDLGKISNNWQTNDVSIIKLRNKSLTNLTWHFSCKWWHHRSGRTLSPLRFHPVCRRCRWCRVCRWCSPPPCPGPAPESWPGNVHSWHWAWRSSCHPPVCGCSPPPERPWAAWSYQTTLNYIINQSSYTFYQNVLWFQLSSAPNPPGNCRFEPPTH